MKYVSFLFTLEHVLAKMFLFLLAKVYALNEICNILLYYFLKKYKIAIKNKFWLTYSNHLPPVGIKKMPGIACRASL